MKQFLKIRSFRIYVSLPAYSASSLERPLCSFLQVNRVFETFDQFFNLSPEVKAKYAKTDVTSANGWDAVERER